MRKDLVEMLVCPACGNSLKLQGEKGTTEAALEGRLVCACGENYPIIASIPRFVSDEAYAKSFGDEWTIFKRTQLDSHNGTNISYHRFSQLSCFEPEALKGKRVLEVGCGMGRFLEVVAGAGAEVIGVDLSRAVESSYENLRRLPNCHFVQADLFRLPFRRSSFDYIYSFGVIHHTPSPQDAIGRLYELLKPGGTLNVWVYGTRGHKWIPRPHKIYGSVLRRLPVSAQLKTLKAYTRAALKTGRLPVIGPVLRLLLPVQDLTLKGPNQDGYETATPRHLSEDFVFEWAYLNSFDMATPAYVSQWTFPQVREWFERAGLVDIRQGSVSVAVSGVRPPEAAKRSQGDEA